MKKILIAFLTAFLCSAVQAGTIYVDTGGSATFSGSTDSNSSTANGTLITCVTTTCTIADASTNLGTVFGAGSTQTSINIAGASNTNRTIFWVVSITSGCVGTAVNCVFVVDTAPTGSGSFTGWVVGGRYLWPAGSTVDKAVAALRGGDTLQFNNNPATRTATFFTLGTGQVGDSTNGNINIIGKAGSRVLLDVGSTATNVIAGTGATNNYIYVSNLEFRQAATSSILVSGFGIAIFDNVKFNHPSGATTGSSLFTAGTAVRILNSEFVGGGAGTTQACIVLSSSSLYLFNSYLHNCNSDGVLLSSTSTTAILNSNIIANNGGSGVNLSEATATSGTGIVALENNTIYSNAVAGLTVADADTYVQMENNIFQNDGIHANVSWTAGNCSTISYHSYNIFYASGGTNLTNCTANASESTTNPLFNNAAGADWSISNSSPAAGAGVPGIPAGSSSTGYRDMGAIQRQVVASGGATGAIRPGVGQ